MYYVVLSPMSEGTGLMARSYKSAYVRSPFQAQRLRLISSSRLEHVDLCFVATSKADTNLFPDHAHPAAKLGKNHLFSTISLLLLCVGARTYFFSKFL